MPATAEAKEVESLLLAAGVGSATNRSNHSFFDLFQSRVWYRMPSDVFRPIRTFQQTKT
jgi:hypothetical protein